MARLLARMPLLLRVLDNIALLDMLLAFFQAVGGASCERRQRAWCACHAKVPRQFKAASRCLRLALHSASLS